MMMELGRERREALSISQAESLREVRHIAALSENVSSIHLEMLELLGRARDLDKQALFDASRPIVMRLLKVGKQILAPRHLVNASEAVQLEQLSKSFDKLRREYIAAIVRVSFDFRDYETKLAATHAQYLTVFHQIGMLMESVLLENEDRSKASADHYSELTWTLAVNLAIAALIALGAAWLISARFSRDLREAINGLKNVANGNPSAISIDKNRTDEIGALGRSISFFEGILSLLLEEISEREKNEAQYKALFDGAGDAVLVLKDRALVSSNKRAAELFGVDNEELRGSLEERLSKLSAASASKTRTAFEEQIRKARSGQPQNFEWQFERSDGSCFPAEVTIAVTIGPDEEDMVQLIVRDISERKEAEKLRETMTSDLERMVSERTDALQREVAARRETETALEAERKTLEGTLENAPLGIVLLDRDGRIIRINSWMKRAHDLPDALSQPGTPYEDVLTHINLRKIGSVFNQEEGEANLADRIGSFRGNRSIIVEDVQPDGSVHLVDRRFLDGVGCIVSVTDVTNLKQAQNDLVRQEKMAALGGLVAGVAHEVNTPLGICVTASTHVSEIVRKFRDMFETPGAKLSRQFAVESLENIGKGIEIIEKNLDRAAGLIKSFKLVAVDQTADDSREIDLGDYIGETLQSISVETKRKNVSIAYSAPSGRTPLKTYPGALVQTLTNLVMNAAIHAYDGKGGEVQIDVQRRDNGGHAIIVRDFGLGMDAKTRKQIFDPFFTTKRANGGTGLGMHIVFNLVTQRLGGKIECRSTPGEGTEFEIILP